VQVVQTTLSSLPFFDSTFDLIVLNGILEWVGEWSEHRSPRDAQLDTLRGLRRLLRPGGMVVIGIENRIGVSSFFNRVDHSGLRFTSLMPRAVASLYLKARRPGFYRTTIDTTRGYRTYTYSPSGYVRLLTEAGFVSVDLWWPPDGYNLPYRLLRMSDARVVRSHYRRERDYNDRVRGYSVRRALKDWLLVRSGLGGSLLPDDLLALGRAPHDHGAGRRAAGESLIEGLNEAVGADVGPGRGREPCHAAMLTSHGFRNKCVITLVTETGAVRGIAKVANERLPEAKAIERSFELLERLHAFAERGEPVLRGSIPAAIALLKVGSLVAGVEAPAEGDMLQDLSMRHDYFSDKERVRRHLELIASWLIAVQSALAGLTADGAIRAVPTRWRVAPGQATEPTVPPESGSWGQHGDFFPENIFLDEISGTLSVIDWDSVGAGYPPLFDWFSLVTGIYYTRTGARFPKGETVDRLSFQQTYFERSWFSDIVAGLTRRLSSSCGLDVSWAGEWFAQYLAVRYHQFEGSQTAESNLWAARYREFYEFFQRHRADWVLDHGHPK
jgi:SAM-dependent methyltransferase